MKKIVLSFLQCPLKNTLRSMFLIAGVLLFCSWDASAHNLMEKDGWRFDFTGLAVGHFAYDTSRSLSETLGSPPIARQGTPDGDNGRTQFSNRTSRFAFGALAPTTETGWKTKGFIEVDFLGYDPTPGSAAGNSEAGFFNNSTLRIRHAYVNSQNNGWQIMAGHYWSLIAWGEDYALSTLSLPPITGVVQARSTQFRVMKTTALSNTMGLETGVAVNRPVQRDAEIPAFDWAARLSFKNWRAGLATWSQDLSAQPMTFAISGTVRAFETGVAGGSTTATNKYVGDAVVISALIPIIGSASANEYYNTLGLTGLFSTGKGYADTFPGYNGNLPQFNYSNGVLANIDAGQGGVDATGVFKLVNLQAWSAQLQYYFPKGLLQETVFHIGYGDLYSNNIKTLIPKAGSIAYDESQAFFINMWHDFTSRYRAGFEFIHAGTNYVDRVDGKSDRYSIIAMYRF